jgi:hypothetical protein
MLMHRSPAMKLFEITIAGRRFAVAREADGDQFYQTYYVDGRDVPVQHYLKMIALAMGTDFGSVLHGPRQEWHAVVHGTGAARITSD